LNTDEKNDAVFKYCKKPCHVKSNCVKLIKKNFGK
jgi:hypothetical protein